MVLGLEKYTSSYYIMNEQTKVEETREKAMIKTIKYEETVRKFNKKTGTRLLERIGGSKRGIREKIEERSIAVILPHNIFKKISSPTGYAKKKYYESKVSSAFSFTN